MLSLFPPKPKSIFRHLKQRIHDFKSKYVLVPADKAANNGSEWPLQPFSPKISVCVKERLRCIGYLSLTKNRIKHDLLQTQVLVLQLNFLNY